MHCKGLNYYSYYSGQQRKNDWQGIIKQNKKKYIFLSLQPIMEYIQAICNLNTYTLLKIEQRKTTRDNNIVVVSQYFKTIHPAMG